MHGELFLILLGLAALVVQGQAEELPSYRLRAVGDDAGDLLDPEASPWADAAALRWGRPPYTTTFRAMHDNAGLWLRYDVDDDVPWHTHTERDAPLWEEEVVEIFIDPDGDGRNYAELEINPAGVVTDLLVLRGAPELDADIDWDLEGLETRVVRPDGDDWIALAHVPWNALAALPDTRVTLPPAPGDRWRFNVFRIKRPGGPEEAQRGAILAAWSPVPGASFHVPERFGWMEFER